MSLGLSKRSVFYGFTVMMITIVLFVNKGLYSYKKSLRCNWIKCICKK